MVKIDALLRDAGWALYDGMSVLYEYTLPDGTSADYALYDRAGRPMAVLEAKRTSVDPIAAQDQGRHYAELLDVPFVFLAKCEEVWHLDRHVDAHARKVATVFSSSYLERRIAVRSVRRKPSDVDTDKADAGRPYQLECIETLYTKIENGRRKLLVEMATRTGKMRTTAAFIKRLFEASQMTRVHLFADRIELAPQAEAALDDYLSYQLSDILKGARGIEHANWIAVAILQTMVNEYDQLPLVELNCCVRPGISERTARCHPESLAYHD